MKHLSKISVLILFMLVDPFFINAQDQSNSTSSSVFRLSGQLGVYGELYSISGKDNRRPPATGRVFINPTLTFFNNFNINFDILLSTEGSYTRQQINRISLHPEWSWGKLHIGDFSQEFSPFTLSGETITGGGLELFPGIFRLEIVGGRTRRKINNGLYNSEYARYLAGIKLGIKKTNGTFFNLNIVRAKDDLGSLPEYVNQNIEQTASTSFRITPKENLVVGINTNLNLVKLFNISGEFAASVLTRDLNSSLIESESIPNFINDIIKLRTSTNVDFAYRTGIKFNNNTINLDGSYSVINPGYQSLGITTNINDRRTISTRAGIRLLDRKLTIRGNYRFQNNNLLSQKQFTINRTSFGLSTRYQPLRNFSFAINASRNIIKNDAEEDIRRIYNVVAIYSINTSLQLKYFNMTHLISGSYSQQQSDDNNILRKDYASVSRTANIGISTMVNENWTISPTLSLSIFDLADKIHQATQSYSLMVTNRVLRSKLSNSLSFNFMNSSNIQSIVLTLQSGYNLSKSDNLKLNLRSSLYYGKLKSVQNFKEYRGTISYTHSF